MIDERKFPFKWMQRTVDYFGISGKPTTSFQLARNIGSCSSDAGEVVKMLAYLTQFGQVVINGENWKLEHLSDINDRTPRGFRVHYLRELTILLEHLFENSASVKDIALSTKMSESDVSYNLNFLSSITSKGKLFIHKKKFPQKWGFRSWEANLSIRED